MGIKNLKTLISSKDILAKSLTGQTIAIDASILLYQYFVMIRSYGSSGLQGLLKSDDGQETSHIQGFLSKCLKMIELGIKPIFVFDGIAPELKKETLAKRKALKKASRDTIDKLLVQLNNNNDEDQEQDQYQEQDQEEITDEINKLEKRSIHVTKEHVNQVKRLLTLLGLPYIDAISEAEATCAQMCKDGLVYACVSEDFDCLAHGAPIFIRHLKFSDKKNDGPQEFKIVNVLKELELNYDEFVDLCILCGTDYNLNIRGIGPKTALKLIKEYKSIEEIAKVRPNVIIKDLSKIRALLKSPVTGLIDKNDIKFKRPDIVLLKKFLVEECSFNEELLSKRLEVLTKGSSLKGQTSITTFFKKA